MFSELCLFLLQGHKCELLSRAGFPLTGQPGQAPRVGLFLSQQSQGSHPLRVSACSWQEMQEIMGTQAYLGSGPQMLALVSSLNHCWMEGQNKKPFSPQRGPFQIRLRCSQRVDNIFTMQHLHCTLFLAMQGTCSSGISPGLCSVFTFIFDHFNSKRAFLGSGYKYQNSHCEEEFKYSEFTFKALVENHCKKFCSCLCLLSCKEKQNHKTLRNKACLQPCPCLDQVYTCGTRVLLVSSWMCLQV